jgi:hypothetical protein
VSTRFHPDDCGTIISEELECEWTHHGMAESDDFEIPKILYYAYLPQIINIYL